MSGLSGSAREVYAFFRQRYGPIAAAGIVGNTQQESSNRAGAGGGGLIQGQGGRTSSGSLQQQLHSVARELEGPERATLAALRAAKTPAEAARIFSQRFERPGVPMLDNRVRYAEEAARQFAGVRGPLGPAGGEPAGQPAPAQLSVTGGDSGPTAALLAQLQKVLAAPAAPQARVGGIAAPAFSAQAPGQTAAIPGVAPAQPHDDSMARILEAALASSSGEAPHITSSGGGEQSGANPVATDEHLHGVVNFDGKPVAAWIVPILRYGQQHGWKGAVQSGYRTFAEQQRIYDSGVRPAALPGTSNHEGKAFPRGAVDVSEAQQLANALAHSPYRNTLVYAGPKDPVHFSHPHNGSY